MKHLKFVSVGHSNALGYAAQLLENNGWEAAAQPASDVTHLLLPVPSFDTDGHIKGGPSLEETLAQLPQDVVIIGGNLNHPALAERRTIDLLQDAVYLAENADITAYCALQVAMEHLPVTFKDCPVLVVGWGRIGKCLARLLRQLGAKVCVAARKETDRAMLTALGYDARDMDSVSSLPFRLVFNTVPAMVLPEENRPSSGIMIELASKPGIGGRGVIQARGLPGLLAPESSGALIARRIIHTVTGKEVSV